MSTFLFDNIIFGPVISRRLGHSLGINLLPDGIKLCNFNCLYCECGWNTNNVKDLEWPSVKKVKQSLIDKINELKQANIPVDTITFAGNGEPTMHPEFAEIVDTVIEVRNIYLPKANVAVLSNGTLIFKPSIFEALAKVDYNILKLDSAIEETCIIINRPTGYYNLKETIENLRKFNGRCIIQTLFVRGSYMNQPFDNTTDREIEALLAAYAYIKPSYVMIYAIDRDTPVDNIQKVSAQELEKIAGKIKAKGIEVKYY
jgi:wyosine [tRNA(Phe)-imidazoG37] synthetase (radical SAM superfamily)